MHQIKMATTILTEAYSKVASTSKKSGKLFPDTTPMIIQITTQTESHFSKNPISF